MFNLEHKRERSGGLEAPESVDEITFKDVHLRYDGGASALSGATFTARRGEMTALVGASGAGKSSIVHLLLGMYERSSGDVRIGGPGWTHDVNDLSLDSQRRLVGIVTQDISLLNTTIREVIKGGDQRLDDADVIEAARRADAHDFIMAMPRGYDTIAGERGTLMSGGQRQRLLIAQILARRTPVLILDEATSALDPISERKVYETLRERERDCLVLVITHRLSSLETFDRIHVLHQGRVVESGDWQQLMSRRGQFWQLSHGERSPSPQAARL